MCGITAIFNIHSSAADLRQQALKMSKRIRHRGPDWSGIYQGKTAILAHERLSIVDPASGGQPLRSKDGKLILTVNGEIYNHRELRGQLKDEYEFQTGSERLLPDRPRSDRRHPPLYRPRRRRASPCVIRTERARRLRHRIRPVPSGTLFL